MRLIELRRLEEDGKVGSEAARDGAFAGRLLAALREDDVRGRHAWADLEDHRIAEAEDPSLYRDLYGLAGRVWVEAERLDHYVVVPADRALLDAWYSLSFAQQQVHAAIQIRPVEAPVPAGFTVRHGGPEDLDIAMRLAYVIFDHQAEGPTWAGAPAPAEEEARASYAEYLSNPKVAYFVAERDGEPLGHLALERETEEAVYLDIAATVPEARGLGVGTALADAALGWAFEQGYQTCKTDWRSANLVSSRFWERRGFVPTAYRLFRRIVLTPR